MPPVKNSKKLKTRSKGTKKFSINCGVPIEDEIFDIEAFHQYLTDRIKVNGKTGNLGDLVKIEKESKKISVVAKDPFSKRYLKYLTKKFLKKKQLRDYIRVISSAKGGYDLKYFNIHQEEEAAET